MITVSVVIPSYNRAHTIGEAIASAHAQTRTPLEILVVDDGSTDCSVEIAEAAGARVIRLPKNCGNSTARNVGIRAAVGDAIAWLDSDDYWEPDHLAIVAGLLDAYPDATAASAAVRLVGTRSGTWYGRVAEGTPVNVVREAFYATPVPMVTAVVRREALAALGGFDETERVAADFDFWLRLACKYKFVATSKVTANYRWHPGQISSNPENQWRATYRFRKRVLDKLMEDGDVTLSAELSEVFRHRWEDDLWTAWEEGRIGWLRQLVAFAPIVPDAPPALRRKWAFRSRLPARAVPLFRGFHSSPVFGVLRGRGVTPGPH